MPVRTCRSQDNEDIIASSAALAKASCAQMWALCGGQSAIMAVFGHAGRLTRTVGDRGGERLGGGQQHVLAKPRRARDQRAQPYTWEQVGRLDAPCTQSRTCFTYPEAYRGGQAEGVLSSCRRRAEED